MKSITLANPGDQNTVRNALSSSNIYAAAVARLYIAHPNLDQWFYSGLWGAVVFCEDRNKNNSYFIRIVDIENTKRVIWEQEFFIGFFYLKETDYFYTFDTDDYFAGIEFAHEGEAMAFYDKLTLLKIQRFGIEAEKRFAKQQIRHKYDWIEKTKVVKKVKEINEALPKGVQQIQNALQKYKDSIKSTTIIPFSIQSTRSFSHAQTFKYSQEDSSLKQSPPLSPYKTTDIPQKPLPPTPLQLSSPSTSPIPSYSS